jgi:hypothetical protein
MDILSWIAWLIIYYNQWGREGYQYQIDGPRAGQMCKADDCRLLLMAQAPKR